jgi:hypothetical protein
VASSVIRLRPLLLGALAVVLLTLPAPSAATTPAGFVRLSDERTITHAAYVDLAVSVRRRPALGARRLARLRPWTFHGSPETVLVLGVLEREGREWSYVRYPDLGSRRGWLPSRALSRTWQTDLRLVLDRERLDLRLFRGAKLLMRTAVGVGAIGSPTPKGSYYIRERIKPSTPNSIYGVLAFGTSAYSPYRTDWPGGGQVGIHGTNQPELIPGRISNGCVRLLNPEVVRLGRQLRLGTPLEIR